MNKLSVLLTLPVMSSCLIVPAQIFSAKALKLDLGDSINSEQGIIANQFKHLVEGYSGGEVEIQLFPGSALRNETEMLQNTRSDELDKQPAPTSKKFCQDIVKGKHWDIMPRLPGIWMRVGHCYSGCSNNRQISSRIMMKPS